MKTNPWPPIWTPTIAYHLAIMNPEQWAELRDQRAELKAILLADAVIFTLLGLLMWAVWR